MRCAGIIAEYNPFHRGHACQIARTRAALGPDTAVVCAMSGHWVQGADCAAADKWTRARLALAGGADLILELPTPWALSSAERFAQGGVEVLHAAGVVEVLSFGSECGVLEPLQSLAQCLDSAAYQAGLRRLLGEGKSFAACRQAAAGALLGELSGGLLRAPNNNLGVEYLRAIRRLGSSMEAMTVLRQGAGHGSPDAAPDGFASATAIRAWLAEGNPDAAAPYLTEAGRALFSAPPDGLPALARAERALLARLRTMSGADWARLPDSAAAEGLPARLCRAARTAGGFAEFLEEAGTRRYPRARVRRLALWAFLGLTAEDFPARLPYLRVLGFNSRGRALLREIRARASLPVLTKPAHVRALSAGARTLFDLESRCTDLYALCFPRPRPCGLEWTSSPAAEE